MKGKYLLLGSNLGNRKENLEQAIRLIKGHIGPVALYSSVFESAAWGVSGEPPYYNQVLRVETALEPVVLLETMLDIERQMGRIRKKKWESRIIDIDLLFYDDRIIRDDHLTLPHPQIEGRNFTLVPLCEIAADEIHPVSGKTMTELLAESKDTGGVSRLDE